VEFQVMVEGVAQPVEVTAEELPAMLATDVTLLRVPTFENRKLRIYGPPDGIEAEGGALIPVEAALSEVNSAVTSARYNSR
jgi:hypothetical protein